MTHGLDKKEPKVASSDKSKVFKFAMEPNQSKPPWKTQKGVSLFIFGNVKAKETQKYSEKFSNICTVRKIEEDKQKQRRHTNWNKQQRSKNGRVSKVRALNNRLVKMMSRPKRKRKRTNRPV